MSFGFRYRLCFLVVSRRGQEEGEGLKGGGGLGVPSFLFRVPLCQDAHHPC